jgi:hypothetical protein
MDLEEEHIRQRIEEREKALKQKVNLLKERIERVKRMGNVKAMVYKRPALMVAGSVLTGFLVKKLASRRHAGNGAYRSSARYAEYEGGYPERPRKRSSVKLKDHLIAILTGVASRTAMNVLSDLTKQIIPRKYDVRRAERNFRTSRHNP